MIRKSKNPHCHGYTGVRQTLRDSAPDPNAFESNASSGSNREARLGSRPEGLGTITDDREVWKSAQEQRYKSVKETDVASLFQDKIQPSLLASDIVGGTANQRDFLSSLSQICNGS